MKNFSALMALPGWTTFKLRLVSYKIQIIRGIFRVWRNTGPEERGNQDNFVHSMKTNPSLGSCMSMGMNNKTKWEFLHWNIVIFLKIELKWTFLQLQGPNLEVWNTRFTATDFARNFAGMFLIGVNESPESN